MKTLAAFLARNPWIYVVLAFALLIGAWSALIAIATKHRPQQIEVRKESY
jgi:hypothetical protein